MEIDKVEILGLLSVMGAVIGALWLIIREQGKKDSDRLDKYEASHDKCHADYHYLKGRMDGVEQLSKSVIKTIADNNDRSVCKFKDK